ncbi:MAG: lyase family protein, partial [Dehalococcoidia bacterium]
MPDYQDYTVSIQYDRRLYRQDIAGSIAHARMLGRQKIISLKDAEQIVQGLRQVQEEIEAGDFPWDPSLEDLHMNIETRLTQIIGPAGGRLHTGRSRNDQIAVDLRIYTKEIIRDCVQGLRRVQRALLELAEAHREVVMPGYTH